MLWAGKNVQSASDKLVKVTEDYVYHTLMNPKPELAAKIRQLRVVRDLDKKNYSLLKRQLPYLVCGTFSPPYRKTENFAYIDRFMIDIDHLSEKGLDVGTIREKLKKDSRVMLLFSSPGEDGLKVLMVLNEKCYDVGIFSLFYKEFLKGFSFQYGLDQVIDSCTCDVTRACFMSSDPEVYFNTQPEQVDIGSYISLGSPVALFDMKAQQEKQEKEEKKKVVDSQNLQKPDIDPDKDTMQRIKIMLEGKKAEQKIKNQVYVPEQLNEILDGLKQFIEDQGISVYEVVNIQYAKKLRCKMGLKLAEVNLFYGKNGFHVVQSPRSGTSSELNTMVADIVQIYLFENT